MSGFHWHYGCGHAGERVCQIRLIDVLAHIHGKWPGAGPFSYVDDPAQTTRGYESGILQTLGPAGVCMAKMLEQAECYIIQICPGGKQCQAWTKTCESLCQEWHRYE